MRRGAIQVRMVYEDKGKKKTVYIDRNKTTRKQFADFANYIQKKDKQVQRLIKIIKNRNYSPAERQKRENKLVVAYDSVFTKQANLYGVKYIKE